MLNKTSLASITINEKEIKPILHSISVKIFEREIE